MKLGSQVTPIRLSSRARLSCISHLLSMISYQDRPPIELPPRRTDISYVRPPMGEQTYVPEEYKRPASFDAVSRSQLVVGSGVAWSGNVDSNRHRTPGRRTASQRVLRACPTR